MSAPTFYIDLDRTAFRTEKASELFAALAELYPDNEAIAHGYEHRSDYYVLSNNHDGDGDKLYHHDIVAQLNDAGIDGAEALRKLAPMVCDGRFEYPGLATLVQACQARGTTKVLTYGEDIYQRFKASICPSLSGLEVITVLAPKADYLNRTTGPDDWMIDDKALVGVTSGAHIVRVGHGERAHEGTHNLEQVADMITRTVPV